jgi:oligopeptide transport system ATP-binding protein
MTSLDPTMKIGKQIMEVILLHQNVSKSEAYEKALKLIELVGISSPEERMKQYPHQFSGGMRQRIVIAIALACEPKILIADEPTTALDVTIQAQILDLMKDLQQKIGASVIFITHDLGVVANVADRVAVMYAGRIVEIGTADDVFYNPQHPYTWGLISSMPDLDTDGDLYAIPGTPPNLIAPPNGDAFALRSEYAMTIDYEEAPPMFKISETHSAATWLLHEYAPEVTPPRAIIKRRERLKEV